MPEDVPAERGPASASAGVEPALHVVATAGHVDHGKSSLILRLTGMDPDRLDEEKRRGLTIDLGFAWGTLPSGREIGFVDVPGHERFVRNMLAGVGPVRLVLLVVAADEGWKPQSEEHLDIVDVLGVDGAIVALTKRDLVDADRLADAEAEVRERLSGTALESAPIVACSSATGEGLEALASALDEMVAAAPAPRADERLRLFVDRVFTIKGAGTVVTGTLTGSPLSSGEEIELFPSGIRARARGLQTHKRSLEIARPVSRVAVNLSGIDRQRVERGDVLGRPDEWRPTSTFEARLRPVRALDRPLTGRGAFKLYAGSAERDARIRVYGEAMAGDTRGSFVRIRLSTPLALDVGDRFVIREAGRRTTVAGGVVLDLDPPIRPGPDPMSRLSGRVGIARARLPAVMLRERGAIRDRDMFFLTGMRPRAVEGAIRSESWWISESVLEGAAGAVSAHLARFHEDHPLLEGEDLASLREVVGAAIRRRARTSAGGLEDAVIEALAAGGRLVREGARVRLAEHRVSLEGRPDVEELVRAVGAAEPTPPTVAELLRTGATRETLDATIRAGKLVRIAPDLVLTTGFVERAVELVRRAGSAGVTVSAVREALGTSRKYAVPLLEHLDATGVTRREGDLRFPRDPS